MQEAQYDFLYGQTDHSDFFSPAMQQLCGIMKDNQVALPSDIGEGYFRYISPCPNISPAYRVESGGFSGVWNREIPFFLERGKFVRCDMAKLENAIPGDSLSQCAWFAFIEPAISAGAGRR